MSENSYDQVPYESMPYEQTNPESMRAAAYLFGINAPDTKNAKILELGCASGNNILAIASFYPKSKCVGVDYSKIQIQEGQRRIKELKVKNLELKNLSILDINEDFGKFDYIICHGVFSWVPVEVQNKILEICDKNLSENGVAYVSYNTMPGWSGVEAIRKMMLYHTERFENPTEKANQARLLLKFINETLGTDNKSFYAGLVGSELNVLQRQSNWYLLHDHLEENNTPYYFHEFMKMADEHDLQYLAETSLASMYSGNLPKVAADVIAQSNDIVRSEQYMDFISNRRFRSTLLCHKSHKVNRNLDGYNLLKDIYVSGNFRLPENIQNYQFASKENVSFIAIPTNFNVTVNDSLFIAAVMALAEHHRKPILVSELAKQAVKIIKKQGIDLESSNSTDTEENIVALLCVNLLRGVFLGGIRLHLTDSQSSREVEAKPKAFSLARYQAGKQNWITSFRQEPVPINELDKRLIPLLNGENDFDQIVAEIFKMIESKDLVLNQGNQPVTDLAEIEKNLPNILRQALRHYLILGII